MYTMTLNDGTLVQNLKLKGNAFWSDEALTEAMFAGKLSPVTITGSSTDGEDYDWGGLSGVHEHMDIAYIRVKEGKYVLALYDIPPERWENERRDANIEYLAMMTGVEL